MAKNTRDASPARRTIAVVTLGLICASLAYAQTPPEGQPSEAAPAAPEQMAPAAESVPSAQPTEAPAAPPATVEAPAPTAVDASPAPQPIPVAVSAPVADPNAPFGVIPTSPSFLETTDRRVRDSRPAPEAEQIVALQNAEAEVAKFMHSGAAYRDTVVSIVRREYTRQRRAQDEGYGRQIREEETAQNAARERAIELFERFIERYPNDPAYTPDSMFRLGELYYERSALQFQEGMETFNTERERRQNAHESTDELRPPEKTFVPTVDLYRKLVRLFPNYRRIDGVLYLIGYCLNEMNQPEEARYAWLALVCSNKVTYVPGTPPPPVAPPAPAAPAAEPTATNGHHRHPAQTMDEHPSAPTATAFNDPFEACVPVSQETQFIGEIWLRIGEYHFDNDFASDGHGLDRAISAYGKVLALPEDRNFNLALYKIAWSYYRASRYVEAIKHFSQLVQWSDDEQQRTGRAGTELRQEAIQYLAITFSYDDWNENQKPDPEEGLPTGFQRIQDPNLLPQDRPWTQEIYFQLGQVYFDNAKYPQAIEVWKFALGKWAMSPRAPEITNLIARAYRRNNDFEHEIETRALLANYGVGTPWYNANTDHPAEQRRAEELAEGALIQTAVNFHQRAQELRSQGVAQRNSSLILQAKEKYRLAADAYRAYIRRYPNNPQAYEINYSLADALYWSENYDEAAREYGQVRDSNLDDSHLSESARRVVEALKRLMDQAVANHQIEVRTEPPVPQGTPPVVAPIAMPEVIQKLAQSREIYLARIDKRHDTENVRDSYDYNNTLLLYVYGYWPQAKARFTRIFTDRCSGADADETGQVAFLNLRNMAVALQQPEEVARLASVLRQRQCTFRSDAAGPQTIDCSKPDNRDNPYCIAAQDLNNEQYRVAVQIFSRAEQPGVSTEDQRHFYEQAATRFIRAVNQAPNDPQAPLALERAAVALQRTQRFDSAARIYQRIIDEVGPRRASDSGEQEKLDNIVSNAYFQLAFSANSNFDYDRAVSNYRVLVDSPRFARTTIPGIVQRREDALVNVANILEYQQQYSQAAQYYRRLADNSRDEGTVMTANYRLAEMSYKQKSWSNTVRDMNSFISRYRSNANAGELVVQAYWRIVEAHRAGFEATKLRASLQDVVDAFERGRMQPGSLAAEYAAQAKFELVDTGITSFESFAVNPGRPADLAAYVNAVKTQITEGSTRGSQLAETYSPIPNYRRPSWTIAAFVRQGRIYEVLARAILNTPFVMPADMARQSARFSQDQRDAIKQQVQDRVQQVLDEQTRPVECLAVVRYALAARAARVGNIDNEFTRIAIDRLNAYGEERVNECVTKQAATDPSFAPPQPSEFARATRGQDQDIKPDIAPPSLAPEDQ